MERRSIQMERLNMTTTCFGEWYKITARFLRKVSVQIIAEWVKYRGDFRIPGCSLVAIACMAGIHQILRIVCAAE